MKMKRYIDVNEKYKEHKEEKEKKAIQIDQKRANERESKRKRYIIASSSSFIMFEINSKRIDFSVQALLCKFNF